MCLRRSHSIFSRFAFDISYIYLDYGYILFYFERENIEKKDRWSYFDIGWSRARLGVIIGMEVIDE